MPKTELLASFSLSEYEERIVAVLDAEIAQKIQRTGIVELSRKVSGDFVIKADSKIGFISVQGVQVNVAPRFPIYNIFYFLNSLHNFLQNFYLIVTLYNIIVHKILLYKLGDKIILRNNSCI